MAHSKAFNACLAHTFTTLLYHIVYSTKNRIAFLDADILPELARLTGGILNDFDGKLLAMNGPENHVHLLVMLRPSNAISDIIRQIKSISSNWVSTKYANRKGFAWQEGYSAFSVSPSKSDSVEQYIANQITHHKVKTFEEELISLLEAHEIEYDSLFVFG